MSLKLDSIAIKGLKCYLDSGIIPFHNLTVFIGENDAGKSTIFDALEYFLENKNPPLDYYREDKDIIEITCVFSLTAEIEELQSYILNDVIKIRKTFNKNTVSKVEVLGEVFCDNDFNEYQDMKAAELRALLEKIGIEPKANQALRQEAVSQYIVENNPEKENKMFEVNWRDISNYLPIYQRYVSSDYGNPTSLIRKTLDLVYRESFYEKDEGGNEQLKNNFRTLQGEIEQSLNTKLETQLLEHIQKYKPEINTISGNYDIDFTRGLSFAGLNVKVDTGRNVSLDQLGDGSKKKIFLSILEWDSEISMEADTTRNIIRAYDEPDAHLHYNAQREMFYIIKELADEHDSRIQSIICTHALTMIDRAPAKCINHVVKENDESKVNFLETEDDAEISDFLNQISEVSGFKNSNIFYEKCFLLVEGEGEQNALPIMYKKYTGRSLIEDGVILINLQTNGQWNNALKFLNVNKKEVTVLFLDSDTQLPDSSSRVTKRKLENIGFDISYLSTNCFFIGTKEFEDVFSDEQYTSLCNQEFVKQNGLNWTDNEFLSIRNEPKFSESLIKLLYTECGRPIGKPEVSLKIAQYLTKDEIIVIEPIKNLFEKIDEIIS